MKTYFEKMLRYERWANGEVLAYLLAHPENEQLRLIFNHLVSDALPWLPILRSEPVSDAVIEAINDSSQWSLTECQAQLDTLQDELDRYLESLTEADINRTVYSTGPQGQPFPNTIAEILTHLLSHGQHHRGQIEWLVEQEAGVYLGTSLMPYLRRAFGRHF